MTKKTQSGFCIAYSVRQTSNKGQGVFAETSVSEDSMVYRNLTGQFKVYDERSFTRLLTSLSTEEVIYELTHVFGLSEFPEFVIRFFDAGVLINHSDKPNIAMNINADENTFPYNPSSQTVTGAESALLNIRYGLIAIRNIEAGDELTMSYNDFLEDPQFYTDLCEQYGVSETYLASNE